MKPRYQRPPGPVARAGLCLLLAAASITAMTCGNDSNGGTSGKEAAVEWSVIFESIGVIRSPYTPEKDTPFQGILAPDVESTIVLEPEYEKGLTDIENFSHIIVLYAFDRSSGWSSMVKPPWDDKRRGVFASRSPRRPNPIGMTVVKLVGREGANLRVQGLDAFDGTPVLDIKPYIPRFDSVDAKGISEERGPSTGK